VASALEIPSDVKRFVDEVKRRGFRPEIVAVERTPAPDETYYVYKDERYIGVRSADDVFRERNFVVCGRLTCACFQDDVIRLVLDRIKDVVMEPEEW